MCSAQLEVKNVFGGTPLHYSASRGHSQVVELLLSAKADVTAVTNSGWTPLHSAASKGFIGCVVPLLKAGALVNAVNNNLKTAEQLCKVPAIKALLAERNSCQSPPDTPCATAALQAPISTETVTINANHQNNNNNNNNNNTNTNTNKLQLLSPSDTDTVQLQAKLRAALSMFWLFYLPQCHTGHLVLTTLGCSANHSTD
jgi:ankyrin repeat protein